MSMSVRSKVAWGMVMGWVAMVAAPVEAASHLWRFNEVFSNADGTIQFIELQESLGATNETLLNGKWVSSDGTAQQVNFTADLIPPTSNKFLLLGTAGFAALPGAPTPDYIMPDGFVSQTGETLRYWTYPAATMTIGAGAIPIDGELSLDISGSTGVNSPTNYAGQSGSVIAGPQGAIPTVSEWGLAAMALLVITAGTLVFTLRRARAA